MRLWLRMGALAGWTVGLVLGVGLGVGLAAGMARVACAQADYPFRDTKLSEDQRITDLMGRLTLEEKLHLLADFPKFPELGRATGVAARGRSRPRPFPRKRGWARPGIRSC
jgi:hypothetical protein